MARVDVVMPKMGESVMEGTVLEWKKAVGETVEQDETLLEISTDKVDSEVPSPAEGRIVEILVQENDTVEVGTPIAIIETDVNAPADGGGASGGGDAPEAAEQAAEPLDVSEPAALAEVEPAAKPAAPIMRTEESAEAEAAPEASSDAPDPSSAPAGGGVEVVMPKMGESVMEGTVLEWKKAVGDEVEQDETLLEISTDKVDSEVPSPAAGTLVQILVEEGETVDVGTPIAIIGSAVDGTVQSPASPEPTNAHVSPALSESTPEAAPASGDAPEPAEKSYGFSGQPGGPGLAEPAQHAASGDGDSGPIPRRDDDGNFYSPLVRSIAETEGVSLSELQSIKGTGSDGRISKADVMGYLETRGASAPAAQTPPAAQAAPAQPTPVAPAQPAPAAPKAATPAPRPAPTSDASGDGVEVMHMDRMRQLIAEHMTRSKSTSAHVTSFAEIDVTGLVAHRNAHKTEFQKREGVKLTYTPYFLHAAVEPLRAHPLLNSSVEGNEIHIKKAFHIGIAVAIGTKGLLVPVVRNAGQQNLTGLTHNIADLAERTRSKKLQPDELQGGTFTITNVGSLGSLMGTPIINQPQVAILSPGAIVKRPVVVEDPNLGDVIAIRQMMYVSLSYDHRIIDGSMAASFLAAYRASLESITAESNLF
ncbi:2-oxoglutarate dehydrogenase, E2 component, dihydrolipoamide succinyltransferase [Rubricoccus marinus]|uniref:Dihydrolipoamide acetyltransferase component of pyruvate dehydrogenase complex n=1 Tax=Rubricoccus marinus TaxID=716817 RepID=A0A259U104_9BACT|nr:2-oxoglutarate dehydrogenase, E2 component, dihydrolipoamide succinyltransferase [Rubricoccus marinus]OZC03661.1 2-oxoglutarate dehydrogenase, E2 component, dihydrolipoamide succinyltransferase [Rubricoccus marinus]